VEHAKDWQTATTAQIGERIAYFRARAKDAQGRKLTAQGLADKCTELGLPIGRPAIAKLEKGLRETITVAELEVIARALSVSPADLVFPLGERATVELMPGYHVDTWKAVLWWSGFAARVGHPSPAHSAGNVHLYQIHYQYLDDWRMTLPQHDVEPRRTIITGLRGIRSEMAERDLMLPELPEDIAAAINGEAAG
jgi:transcriptional regulator with XRE-family HTH domain